MIPLTTMDYLITQRMTDSRALLIQNRNSAAVYLMGYALEMTLKKKICMLWNFSSGFPENPEELKIVLNCLDANPLLGLSLPKIRDIKSHNLSKLLIYSGCEFKIKDTLLDEWNSVLCWQVEMRYKIKKFSQQKACSIIKNMKIVITKI